MNSYISTVLQALIFLQASETPVHVRRMTASGNSDSAQRDLKNVKTAPLSFLLPGSMQKSVL